MFNFQNARILKLKNLFHQYYFHRTGKKYVQFKIIHDVFAKFFHHLIMFYQNFFSFNKHDIWIIFWMVIWEIRFTFSQNSIEIFLAETFSKCSYLEWRFSITTTWAHIVIVIIHLYHFTQKKFRINIYK